MYPQGMSERGQLDAKIAELLALLNAPDDKVLEDPQDPESKPLSELLAAPEETRLAKYVAAIMQKPKP